MIWTFHKFENVKYNESYRHHEEIDLKWHLAFVALSSTSSHLAVESVYKAARMALYADLGLKLLSKRSGELPDLHES